MPSPPAKSPFRPGALLAGKYRLLQMLGRGASGVVWSATNVTTSRKVALKLLLKPDPKQRERLLREARAAGALNHPNVVDIYDVTTLEDGSPVLVLQLLEGQSLQELIDTRGALPPNEAAGIGRDVARALSVAHASGIVHRDLKPANIFLHAPGDDPPVVKVVDFGISKNILAAEGTLTETGMAVGSPAFMSPEQVRGERDLDGRTDLWSLGVIIYEMLAGKRLFDGRTHEVLTQVLVEPIKPIESIAPTVDLALSKIVHGLLERDLKLRLSSAEDVAERLSAIFGSDEKKSVRPTKAPHAPPVETHDTTVVPLKMTETKRPVPKAYEDDDDDEATHVAPVDLRKALAQKTVPKVYADDDEEDEVDRTRVAGQSELTAGIVASRSVGPVSEHGKKRRDENQIATLRPPPNTGDNAALFSEAPPTPRAPEQVLKNLAKDGNWAGTESPKSEKGLASERPLPAAGEKASGTPSPSSSPQSTRHSAPPSSSKRPSAAPPASSNRLSAAPLSDRPTRPVPVDENQLATIADTQSTRVRRSGFRITTIAVVLMVVIAVLLVLIYIKNTG